MAVFEIFSHPEQRRYKSHVFSKATFLHLACILLTFIPPLLIAYRSQGFWKRFDTYREQPDISFKKKLISIIELEDGTNLAWSTYQNFNQLQLNNTRIPLIKTREEDTNRDGKKDLLRFSLQMPLNDRENVIGVKLLLVFDYKLYKFSTFQMESLAYIHFDSARPGSSFKTTGDLLTVQRQALSHSGRDTRFNISVISETAVDAASFRFSTILEQYMRRNVTTRFDNDYPLWLSGRGKGQPFIIEATVVYPEEYLTYAPGFWHVMKWAWVQYIALLALFMFLFYRTQVFIFQNQIVSTIVQRPFQKDKTS